MLNLYVRCSRYLGVIVADALLICLATQVPMKPAAKPGLEEDTQAVHRIRITLTSRNVKNLEKGAKQSVALPCCLLVARLGFPSLA